LIPVLSREQVRDVDRHAVDVCHVPSIVLMENAGRGAAELVLARLEHRSGLVVVVCGAGNNGGDGFVVARRLLVAGASVRVLFTSSRERLRGDALVNHDAWLGVGGTVDPVTEVELGHLDELLRGASIVVDALLGTGLDRPVTGLLAAVIERVNRAPGLRVALDVPSGLDANTGCPLGVSVRADETVTFAALKLGLVTSIGADHAGRVTVVDIGIPASAGTAVGTSARQLERADVASWLLPRAVSAHKGSAGRVLAIAGSPGKTGAALLVARGALRAGAGLVTLCTFPEAADALDRRVLEEMTARLDPSHLAASLEPHLRAADAVVIGPGLGLDAGARAVVDHVLGEYGGPVLVDADALTHLAGRLPELRSAKGRLVLTPHPGEMSRLLGVTTREVEADRFAALADAVEQSRAVVLLKGARTLVGAPGELPVVNPSGTPALATAGSGDVLSGVSGAFLAALGEPFHAACVAAYVHGLAGEAWASVHGGDRGLLAHEIADGVLGVLAGLTRSTRVLPV
jgi:ADP-dependent NAD(P)H-hydrate dehydratase / NAD(P)H-hydrate epimerase